MDLGLKGKTALVLGAGGGLGGAMENWGGITYYETALLFDPANSSAATKQTIYEVIAHEVAHQLFHRQGSLPRNAEEVEAWEFALACFEQTRAFLDGARRYVEAKPHCGPRPLMARALWAHAGSAMPRLGVSPGRA